jgi:mercuric ion transport protein
LVLFPFSRRDAGLSRDRVLARHRASNRACVDWEACARPLPNRLVRAVLVVATILVMIAIGFDFLAPLFLNS